MITKRNKWRIGIILLFTVPFAYLEIKVTLQSNREERLFSKIKPGMTATQVTALAGKPDTILCSGTSCDWQYFTQTSYKSTNPFITFDSIGLVSYVYEFK